MPSHFRITTRWCSVKHSIWNETFLVGRPPLLCAWVWLSGYSDDYKIEWNVFIVLELVFSLQHSKTVEEQEEIEINSIKLLFCCFESIFFYISFKKADAHLHVHIYNYCVYTPHTFFPDIGTAMWMCWLLGTPALTLIVKYSVACVVSSVFVGFLTAVQRHGIACLYDSWVANEIVKHQVNELNRIKTKMVF